MGRRASQNREERGKVGRRVGRIKRRLGGDGEKGRGE